jgi:hypothetical protein
VCLDFDNYIQILSFSDLKEDPHCVMMESTAKPHESVTEGIAAVNGGQNCNNDKTPNMEEKLQEVEKVKIACYSF